MLYYWLNTSLVCRSILSNTITLVLSSLFSFSLQAFRHYANSVMRPK